MFRYAANVSALEFVPTSLGHLIVDVVVPACPHKKDSDSGEFVETFWCPVTGACEATCYSFLGMQNDWWGPGASYPIISGTRSGGQSGAARQRPSTSAAWKECATTLSPVRSAKVVCLVSWSLKMIDELLNFRRCQHSPS